MARPVAAAAAPHWIGVDWGTSALRVWLLGAQDEVLGAASSDEGMGGLRPEAFEPALLRLIAPWLPDPADQTAPMPVIICGMAGARGGWREAPYREVPCAPLSKALQPVAGTDPRLSVQIIPGLCQRDPADVMRGEETQIAGFLANNAGFSGTLCLPGTHSKWVRIRAGEITGFQTCMTGELFALLAHASVLRLTLAPDDPVTADPEADALTETFLRAVADALAAPERFSTSLFALRAGALLAGLAPAAARARLSGLLIGQELAASREYWGAGETVVIGENRLAAQYHRALGAEGARVRRHDAAAITLAGLCAARALARKGPTP